jgi:hypothetical protein
MDAAVTVLVDAVLVLWVMAVIVAIVRAWNSRGPRLEPISPQAQRRFELSWDRISRRFMFAPREAAQEADMLTISLLKERGHSIRGDRLPHRIRDARGWLSRESADGTEALRQAMICYRAQFERTIGKRPRAAAATGRRELA